MPLAPERLGGVSVSGETLGLGAKIYSMRCATCHGGQGDGEGPTGRQQKPKPRDFRLGVIKYKSTPGDELATDGDYARTITHGLKGTNMLALPLSPSEVEAVTQYVKTFSAKWKDPNADAGTPVKIPEDPWTKPEDGVTRGRIVTHTIGACIACHPSAMSADEVKQFWSAETYMGEDAEGLKVLANRADLRESAASETLYGWVNAPKFEGARFKAGNSEADLARLLAAGAGGTKMKGMTDKLSARDFWAVVHYLHSVAAPE